ncbi:hypothetical protein [Sulfurimonas sp. CS5]|uniref:hypothetical protein n=1 Tax=Sulfurimonas sp. CS5 TaxID=3391145 RepID=UPI0039E77418
MKKTLLSLAAASLIVTSAVAADKGIDIVTTGQAVLYYETSAGNGTTNEELFDQGNSQANVGIQLNLDADLKNNFTFGSQLSYLGTAGLEKNLVSGTRQSVTGATAMTDISDEIALTKIFIAKKIANTTVKIGRQELPMSLSPLAFSEGWNVFKNTFEAALLVNSDIPDTLVVGAYVGQSNNSTGGSFSTFNSLNAVTSAGTTGVGGTAYMLTVQNKSIPMTTVTASYYDLAKVDSAATADLVPNYDIGATALWGDVAIAGKDLPMGLKVGLQAGQISPDSQLGTAVKFSDTTAFGVKVGLAPIEALTLCAAFTSVDGDDNKENVAVKNTGTGVKTPLFTQMIYNQNAIALDADTYMIKAVYNTGDYGKIIAQYAGTAAGKSNLQGSEIDYAEFDLIYKVKAAGVEYFASYINRSFDKGGAPVLLVTNTDATTEDVVRVWARYAF